jgi:hypothetical protein
MAKRGRPVKPDAKRKNVMLRLNDKQASMLRDLSKRTGRNQTDIFVGLMEEEYKKNTDTEE